MKVGLISVDGHNFPNLALMRISAWHKAQGDEVEWWQPQMFAPWYDVVYMSKVFSDAYTPDMDDPINAGKIIRGGTGYCISLVNGKEVFDESKNMSLPPEMEKMFPDYSIYPKYDYAVALTSRGCPRGCGFCVVGKKDGRCSVKVADVIDFWNGQKEIKVLDPNITACREKRDLFRQYRETGAWIDFTQGLDIRLLNHEDIADLNEMKIKMLHFAWDNPNDDLIDGLRRFAGGYIGFSRGMNSVYCLTNYEDCSVEEHIERALYRVYRLQEICGEYNPYIMIYDKPHADKRLLALQRWCNNKFIYRACRRFEDYRPSKK